MTEMSFTTRYVIPTTVGEGVVADELNEQVKADAEEQEAFLERVEEALAVVRRDLRGETRDQALEKILEEVRKEARAKLPRWKGDNLRPGLTRLNSQLYSPTMPEGVDSDELQYLEREIRDRLAGMDPGDVFTLALSRAAEGDGLFLRALQRAPSAFPILPPDQLQEVSDMYAEATKPDLFQQREELDLVIGVKQSNAAMTLRKLQEITNDGLRRHELEREAASDD